METDEGLLGYGEATVSLSTMPVAAAIREMSHLCIGKDPRHIHALWETLYKALYLAEGQVQRAAMGGIEMACWDILGKSLNAPVYQLLGGRCRDGIRAYANGWYQGPRDAGFLAERATQVVEMGYTALKFDPFGRAYRTMTRDEEQHSLALVRAVREAIGSSVDLIIEAHDRFTVSTAIRIGQQLAEFAPLWYETPVHSSDIDDLVAVARSVPVPLGVGERFTTQREFAALLKHEIIDILQPETIDLGGVWAAREVCSLGTAHNAVVAIHNARGPICTTVNCHLDLTLTNFLIQEFFDNFNEDWTRSLVRGTPTFKDGYLYVSDRPGFGLEVDEEIAQAHPYGENNFLRLFEEGWETRRGGSKS